MRYQEMGVAKKAALALAMAAGLAVANTGGASAAGYPEGVTFNNQHFDVHYYSGGCRVEAKFSYTSRTTWVANAVRSGESTCNLYINIIYKGTDGKLHLMEDWGRRNVSVAGWGTRCEVLTGVQRPDFSWYTHRLTATTSSACAGATW
ncbi:hypothetical protein ACIGZJ_29895 [Kitasatospora sp. NPDC052868]|uniref:hypothetical protein n=1 Tax=Kitasatospora sp. NPDC052868 TaxID=3364060 RepID=UPI0037C76456